MDIDLEKIIGNTKKVVLSAIKNYLHEENYEYIDDVTQEVYFRVYKSLKRGKFREQSKLSTWIYIIAKNESFRLNAKIKKQNQLNLKIVEQYQNNETDNFETNSKLSLLDFISKLPIKYQSLIESYINGFTEKEIASQFSLKLGTVKSRIHRAKEILKRELS